MAAARARGKRNESRLPRLRKAAEDANMDYRVAEKELEIVAQGYEVTLRSLRDQLLADGERERARTVDAASAT